MSPGFSRHVYLAQRVSAMVLAPLVIAHLLLIFIAVKDGLTADEILSRTRGNVYWAAFYGLFVVAAAIHAPLGLRSVLREWTALPSRGVDVICVFIGILLLATGLRAVVAVI